MTDSIVQLLDLLGRSSCLQLAAFAIGAVSLILQFEGPRTWVESKFQVPRPAFVLWIPLLIVVAAALLVSASVLYGLPAGFAVLDAALAVAFSLWLSRALGSVYAVRKARGLLLHVYSLHAVRYKLRHWTVVFTIDDKGGVHTKESMLIQAPPGSHVYFRHCVLGLRPGTPGTLHVRRLMAYSSTDGHGLEIVELERDKRKLDFAVVLNPPASERVPSEITIESYRPLVFRSLLTQQRAEGRLRVYGSDPGVVSVAFISPPSFSLKTLTVSPAEGACVVSRVGGLTQAVWSGQNVPNGTYTYVLEASKAH